MTNQEREEKRKKKRKNESIIAQELIKLFEKSLKKCIDQSMKDIFNEFK